MKLSVARLYSFGVGLAGLAILLSLSERTLLQRALSFAFFAGLSLFIKRLGFHVFDEPTRRSSRSRHESPSEVTHSLVGVVDLSALLLHGPVFGGWVAALSEFTYLMLRRPRRTRALQRWEVAIFNAGLKVLMALAGGAAYVALGGGYQPSQLTLGLLLPLAALFLTWFLLDHVGWSIRIGLTSGFEGIAAFLRGIMLPSFLVELVPLPMSLVLAVVYVSLGWPIFVLLAGGFVVTGFIIQRLVAAWRRLQTRVNQLDAISEVSRQVAAIINLDDLFARVVELTQDSFEYDHVRIFTRGDGSDVVFRASTGREETQRRAADYRLPLGEDSIIGWVAQHGEPLLINDVFSDPRYAVDKLGILTETQAELAVPLKVEDRVLGVLDVQNDSAGSFDEDDLFVLQTLADQIAIAIEDARLYEEAREREQLQQELRVALNIQTSLLPATVPIVADWDIAAAWQPARNVAGDFYDFIPLGGERWGILIADVSDKGVPAAIYMAVARTLMRAMAIGKDTPAAALERANDLILADARTDMFVTVFYAVVDTIASELTYVNAGHLPPLWYKRQAGSIASLRAHGIALGVIPDIELEQCTVRMAPGDLLVLYTDGITEAVNDEREEFGEERLARLIFEHPDVPADDLVAIIENALNDFVGNQPPFDDRALLVLKRMNDEREVIGAGAD